MIKERKITLYVNQVTVLQKEKKQKKKNKPKKKSKKNPPISFKNPF